MQVAIAVGIVATAVLAPYRRRPQKIGAAEMAVAMADSAVATAVSDVTTAISAVATAESAVASAVATAVSAAPIFRGLRRYGIGHTNTRINTG